MKKFTLNIILFKIVEDLLPNGDFETTADFLEEIYQMMLIFIKKSFDRDEKVCNYFKMNFKY